MVIKNNYCTFASAYKSFALCSLNGALTFGRVTSCSKEPKQASLFARLLGALDEWLSLRSAKPSTAVRIRQAPLSKFGDSFKQRSSRFFLPKLKALMHFKRFIQLFSPKSFVFLQAENYKNLQYEKTFSDYYLCTRCIIK